MFHFMPTLLSVDEIEAHHFWSSAMGIVILQKFENLSHLTIRRYINPICLHCAITIFHRVIKFLRFKEKSVILLYCTEREPLLFKTNKQWLGALPQKIIILVEKSWRVQFVNETVIIYECYHLFQVSAQ